MERRLRERQFAFDPKDYSQVVKVVVPDSTGSTYFYLPCGGIYWTQRIEYAIEHVLDLNPKFAEEYEALSRKGRRSSLTAKLNGEVVTDYHRSMLPRDELTIILSVEGAVETRGEICAICLEDLSVKNKELTCKHKFHTSCIDKWLEVNWSCPLCRRTF